MSSFDPATELAGVRAKLAAQRALRRRRPVSRSKLDDYRYELAKLHAAGATLAEITEWLKTKHRVSVHGSTVHRYLSKFDQEADNGHAS